MMNYCAACGYAINDNDKVIMEVQAVYHSIPSKSVFALNQKDLTFVPGTLTHLDCEGSYFHEYE